MPARNQRATAVVLGTSLLVVGALLLMRATLPWFHGPMFWPLVVIAGGAVIVAKSRR